MRLDPDTCPLCGGPGVGPSWQGAVIYRGSRYQYTGCRDCSSAFCTPMPSAEVLAQMYGPAYGSGPDAEEEDPKDPDWVVAWLRQLGTGRFLDFGCGKGGLLSLARQAGWEAVGVELDPAVAEEAQRTSGAPVHATLEDVRPGVDVIHLGDVIEHLTHPLGQVRTILTRVRDRGIFLAQGPLEGGPSLFTLGLRATRALRAGKETEMPPYHVLQATIQGQRRLFDRLGLHQVEYLVSEVSWPAPPRLRPSDYTSPRKMGLFFLSVTSRVLSRICPGRLGNRYRYAARVM